MVQQEWLELAMALVQRIGKPLGREVVAKRLRAEPAGDLFCIGCQPHAAKLARIVEDQAASLASRRLLHTGCVLHGRLK